MSAFFKDFRQALRALLRSPGATAVMIVSLALGIGACTTIFSLINAWVLRPLPFPAASDLMVLREVDQLRPDELQPASFPNMKDWQQAAGQVFDDLGGLAQGGYTIGIGQGTEWVEGALVSPNQLHMLAVRPALGRSFTEEDGRTGAERVTMLSDRLWRERFGAAPDVVGQSVKLDGQPHTIVGVLPPSFEFVFPGAQVWVPLVEEPIYTRELRILVVTGRLKPGVTQAAAQAHMDTVARRLAQEYPEVNKGFGIRLVPLQYLMLGPNNKRLLTMLMGCVAFVLLIACFNVANLLAVRSAARSREMGVRSVLGAGYGRLSRQLLTESLALGLLGGLGGILVSYWGMKWLVSSLPVSVPRLQDIGFDPRVIGFLAAIAVGTTLLFGLAPVLQIFRVDLRAAIGAGVGGAMKPSQRLRSVLVVAEVSLALVLLVMTGLTMRSAVYLQNVSTGFDTKNLLTLETSLTEAKVPDDERIVQFQDGLLTRLAGLQGVKGAAVASFLPRSREIPQARFTIDGRPEADPENPSGTNWLAVSPSYFGTLGIPLRQGRALTAADRAGAAPVVVVDEELARQYFPGENPLGRRLTVLDQSREIVGVVGSVLQTRLVSQEGPMPTVYLPFAQQPARAMAVLVRSTGRPEALAGPVRQAFWSIDRDQPVLRVMSMESYIATQFEGLRLIVRLLAIFAVIALVLAVVGVYGIVSYATSSRFRELGVRMALGADRPDVARTVLRGGLLLIGVSLAIGLTGASLLAGLMASLFFGVKATDPMTLLGVSAVLLVAAVAAMAFPTRRALRLDPAIVLRYE